MSALTLIDSVSLSGTASTVTLGGADWDNSFDVYKVVISNLEFDTDTRAISFRYLDSSNAAIDDSNYKVAFEVLKCNTAFENAYGSGTHSFITDLYIGTGTGECANLVMYLFNSNDANEYSFHTLEAVYLSNDPHTKGQQGGGVLLNKEVTKGVQLLCTASGNFDEGEFRLYGLKK